MEGLIIDSFAGGGGASTGIELALGRSPDVAINHDEAAVTMHMANHPDTTHYCKNVWHADPVDVVRAAGGGPVSLAWFSPDCKHFSKAKGGRPAKRNIRDLAWVVVLWAKRARPRIIMLENVEEFRDWGPLTPEGKPCPERKGETFNRWVGELKRLGYTVEWQQLRACDYGAPTIRKRLFLVARCDGLPIAWPEPTHGAPDSEDVLAGRKKPYRTAADIIDWTLPCPSIFERKKPLAEATCRRIARGLVRYVIEAERPFIVPITHTGGVRVHDSAEPLRTITTAHRGELAVVAPTLVTNTTGHPGAPATEPLRTITTGGHHAMVAAFLAKHYGGVTGHGVRQPIGTVTTWDHHSLVATNLIHMGHGESCSTGAKRWSDGTRHVDLPLNTVTASSVSAAAVSSHIIKLKGTCRDGQPVSEPLHTVAAGGNHFGEVRAFLMKYYGTDQDPKLQDPLHTVTTKDRFGLVTVNIDGEPYAIADIGMRMLQPHELFAAQGFPEGYIIKPDVNGKPMTKTDQVRMAGNSVCPPLAEALVRANVNVQARTTGATAAA